MKIKVCTLLQPHTMLIQIGGRIPTLFEKKFEVDLDPANFKHLIAGSFPIDDHTFCEGQIGKVLNYDDKTNTLVLCATMQSATSAYFSKLKLSGWIFNEQATSSGYSRYSWSEAQEAAYNKERQDQEALYRSLDNLVDNLDAGTVIIAIK